MKSFDVGFFVALLEDYSLFISVLAMFVVIIGTVIQQGSMQRVLFLVGVATLGVMAFLNDELMLTILQIILTLAAVLAFLPTIVEIKAVVLFAPAIVGIGYLRWIDYGQQDAYWAIGAVGLLILAAGISVSAAYPFYFDIFVATGSMFVAFYALLKYISYEIKIQLVWIILNTAAAVNPARRAINYLR